MSSKIALTGGNLVDCVVPVGLDGAPVFAPAAGQAAASASMPVTLSNENVQDLNFTGQSGQIGTVNNILTVVAGSAAIDVNGYRSGSIQIGTSGSVTGGGLTLECSADNVTFYAIPYVNQSATQSGPATASSSAINPSFSVGNAILTFNIPARYIRLRISSAVTGGGSVQVISRFSQTSYSPITVQTFIANGQSAHSAAIAGNPVRTGGAVTTTLDTTLVNADSCNTMMTTAGQTITKEFGSAENDWSYAAASGGIVNTTTAVTIKAAGAAGIRNYLPSIDLYAETLGAATEFAIRDGAGGTVLWRQKIPTTGMAPFTREFKPPLRGSAATLMEVVTLTASISGAVYFNGDGYQSA